VEVKLRVQVGDVRLHFDAEGPSYAIDGNRLRRHEVALLLPGGPGQGHFHNKHIPPFPRDLAQIIHVDHRGTGKSDRNTSDKWNLETWTKDVVGFCEALEIVKPILVGVSFGATLALNVAEQHPELPSRLVLVSGPARFDGPLILDAFERLGGESARAASQSVRQQRLVSRS
jgi:proline iminopeptidase